MNLTTLAELLALLVIFAVAGTMDLQEEQRLEHDRLAALTGAHWEAVARLQECPND